MPSLEDISSLIDSYPKGAIGGLTAMLEMDIFSLPVSRLILMFAIEMVCEGNSRDKDMIVDDETLRMRGIVDALREKVRGFSAEEMKEFISPEKIAEAIEVGRALIGKSKGPLN